MYSPQLLDHFEHPRNVGELPPPAVSVEVSNPVCGDVLRLSAREEQGTIREIRFRAKGCVATMACASAITELARGRTLEELVQLRREQVIAAVGALPEASTHAAQLAVDAAAALVRAAQAQRAGR